MALWRNLASLGIVMAFTATVQAQAVSLGEAPLVDSYCHVQLSMALSGSLKLQQNGKDVELKETVTAAHDFVERVLEIGPDGAALRSARVYKDATVVMVVNDGKQDRTLRPERRFLIVQRDRDALPSYCPKGALTREELDVTDHFDTLALSGLLPAKDVTVGDSWMLTNAVVQALCHFQGLSEHNLTACLDQVQEDIATFTVTGTAQGIDLGASAMTTVNARCRFDTKLKRIIGVTWTQKDERSAGPVSPESSLEMTIQLRREPVEPVGDLSDVLVPARESQPAADLIDLVFSDTRGRFELHHGRDWQLVAKSEQHIVWRLMDRGEFVCQASLAPWQKAEAGQHLSPEEVKSIVANSPGWAQDTLIKAEEVKLPTNQWAYLVAGEGDLDGVRAVQYFYLVAGPGGEQTMLTFTTTPGQIQKLGSRDLEFVRGLELRMATEK